MARPITEDQARFLGLGDQAIIISQHDLQKRIDCLFLIYSSDRFAPMNREANAAELKRMCQEDFNLVPKVHVRYGTRYCGNSYVLPNAVVGTLAECREKGKKMGDRHGKVPVVVNKR